MEGGYGFLLDLALILLSTKLLGLLTQRFQLPQVVGALLAGLILGPAVLNVIQETEFIKDTAEIGVIVMMFCAGMETDVNELKHSGKAAFVIALIGVIVPILGGFGLSYFFNKPGVIESDASTPIFLQNLFIGVILTATSVSISVETLKELGKLKTRSGNAILGAAIIDDVLGIIALTVISSMADSSVSIWVVLLQILGFFVFVAVAGFLFYKFYIHWVVKAEKGMHRHVIIAFVFCLLMSFVAEVAFGVADITGAFCAGVIISMTQRSQYLNSKFDVLSYAYLSPLFFASIGLQVTLPAMTPAIVWFSVLLIVVAVLTKVVGCGLGAKLCHYQNYQAARIGVGMISRGEVALIVASKGMALGLMGNNFLGPVIFDGGGHHHCHAHPVEVRFPLGPGQHAPRGEGLLRELRPAGRAAQRHRRQGDGGKGPGAGRPGTEGLFQENKIKFRPCRTKSARHVPGRFHFRRGAPLGAFPRLGPSHLGEFHHQPVGQQLGENVVELVKGPLGVGHLPTFSRPQRALRHLPGVHPGQLVNQAGFPLGYARHVPEGRVHGAGAHGAHPNAPGPQLLVKRFGKGGYIGLRGAVDGHSGGGGKGGDGGDVQHQAVIQHIGKAQPGNARQGTAVQVHHAGLGFPVGGKKVGALAIARVVYQYLDLRLVFL